VDQRRVLQFVDGYAISSFYLTVRWAGVCKADMSSRRRELAVVFALGFAAGVLVCAMVFTGRSIAPAATPEAALVLMQRDGPLLSHTRGAKPMDPPVLPRLLNALKVKISEENRAATLDLLADTPNATVSVQRTHVVVSGCLLRLSRIVVPVITAVILRVRWLKWAPSTARSR
jgi:hypothetical protein